MFLAISDILDADALTRVRSGLKTLRWDDGSKTAGHKAREVKANQQADLSSRTGAKLRDELVRAIQTHTVLRSAAQPRKFSKILISRTEVGGGYGLHIDNPFMGSGETEIRTDLSFTLFLSDPADYEGGELSIDLPGERKFFKPEAGTLILYPTQFLHRVNPVTRGTRLACVGWIESRVKRENQRMILFDLENLSATLSETFDAQSDVSLTLSKIITNLKREFD